MSWTVLNVVSIAENFIDGLGVFIAGSNQTFSFRLRNLYKPENMQHGVQKHSPRVVRNSGSLG